MCAWDVAARGKESRGGPAVFSVRRGFGIFHKGICLFSVDERDARSRAGGEAGMLLGGRGVVHRGQLKLLYPNVASEAQDYKGKRKWPS